MSGQKYGVLNLLWDIRDSRTICERIPRAKATLMALASRSNADKGFTCFPSEEMLAGDVQVCVRDIRERLKTLATKGLITRQRRFDASYIYCLAVDKIQAAAKAQREEWEAKKQDVTSPASAEDQAFEQAVEANRKIATPATVAEDASFPKPDAVDIDYAAALAAEIRNWQVLSDVISNDEAKSLATAICRECRGCAPLLAFAHLTQETLAKVAAAKDNPPGYLLTVLRGKVKELMGREYARDAEAIEKFAEQQEDTLGDGYDAFCVELSRAPAWSDDRIVALHRREIASLGLPSLLEFEGEMQINFPIEQSGSAEALNGESEEDVDDEYESSSADPYHFRVFPVPHHPGENMDQMLAAELE